jgi:hypothetical protein
MTSFILGIICMHVSVDDLNKNNPSSSYVGGTTFVTTRKTLTAWTSYFDSDLVTLKTNEPLFVDADPNAFCVLLSFMRHGSVDSSLVTDVVLKQAIHFRIEGFISFVQTMDRIVLNVRGTIIETSKLLLKEHSAFFQDQFSTHWAMELHPFLNQDPEAFRTCLEFMTRGHIESSKLTNDVLELAELLGMTTLINAVKVKLCWAGSDERSIDKFNDEYGSISNAITSCSTSSLMQHCHASTCKNVEYASVYLHRKPSAARTSLRLPFRACVYGNVSPELLRMGDTINVLNKMAREGFALAHAELQQSWSTERNLETVPGLGRILAHVLFVKQDATEQRNRTTSIQSKILDSPHGGKEIQPREFVALLRPAKKCIRKMPYDWPFHHPTVHPPIGLVRNCEMHPILAFMVP